MCRSVRYWACRETFWSFVDHACKFVVFLASSGAVMGFIDKNSNSWGANLSLAAALATFVIESFAVQAHITFAVKQCQRYSAMLTMFPVDASEEDLRLFKRVRDARLLIEKDETIILECLDVKCHNKICQAEDRPQDMKRLNWWQKSFGQVFPLPYPPSVPAR